MTEIKQQRTDFRWIDLTEAVNVIYHKYDRPHLVPEAMWEAAALWGVTPETNSINDSGVFISTSEEIRLHSGKCKAKITLVEAPNGNWAMSTSYEMATEGGSYAPSIWKQQAFPTREDARIAAHSELMERFRYKAETISDARKMMSLLEAERTTQKVEKPEQMTLGF